MKSPSRARTLPAANRFLLSLLLSGVLLLLLQPAAAQQDLSSSVQLRLEMFVVSEVDGREQYTPSITARAGETVEYRILARSEEHTSELQSRGHIVCRLLL